MADTKVIDGRGVAEVLDHLRRKEAVARAEVPAAERGPWMAAVAFGFVKLEKFDRFWWFTLTDEAHKG